MIKIFSSYAFSIFIGLIIIVSVGIATFLPQHQAFKYIYNTLWFEGLFFLVGLNLIWIIFQKRLYKKVVFILHLSILVILFGAFISRHFSVKGEMVIKNGETKQEFYLIKDGVVTTKKEELPFKIKLIKFEIKRYLNSDLPSSYESLVEVIDKNRKFKYKIYMNHLLSYKGYRIFQSDFLKDSKGSILFINYDKGIYITYFGYFLFLIGVILIFLKKSRILILILALFNFSYSFNLDIFVNNSKLIESQFFHILVQYNGRITSLDTLNKAFLNKISSADSMYGMDYNQIAMLILINKEFAKNLPLIKVDKSLLKFLNVDVTYLPYDFFFKNGEFLYKEFVKSAFEKSDAKKTKLDRAWISLNDKLVAFYEMQNYDLLKIFPTDASKNLNNEWFNINAIENSEFVSIFEKMFYKNLFSELIEGIRNYNLQKVTKYIYENQKTFSTFIPSKLKIDLEIFLNHFEPFFKLIFIYFALFVLYLFLFVMGVKKGYIEIFTYLVVGLNAIFFGIRWYVSGYIPISDAYESLIFIALLTALIGAVFRNYLLKSASFLASAIFLLVAYLNSLNPEITPLIPVLKSYWLSIHVSIIMFGDALFAVGFFVSIVALLLNKNYFRELYMINIVALLMFSTGTFLGGVWASESWGDYWSFDVKESWSLIVIVVYAITTHLMMHYKKALYVINILSFSFVLMSFFGVNFYLSKGLHSYGQEDISSNFWIYIIILGMILWIFFIVVELFKLLKGK